MTTKDVRDKFRIEMNAKSDGAYNIFVNEELDEFVSFGIRQFYERRLSGLTSDRTSFEQWQKRSDDLRAVYTKYEATSFSGGIKNGCKWVSYAIPDDYWHMLSEDIDIVETNVVNGVSISNVIGTFDVFECTTDNLTARMNDSLGPHIYYKKQMRPLRMYKFNEPNNLIDDMVYLSVGQESSDDLLLLQVNNDTDLDVSNYDRQIDMYSVLYYKSPDNISLGKYYIEYMRKPNGFGIYSDEYIYAEFDETDKISQVPDYAWDEVLSIAIKHALENTSSYRIQTYNSERLEIQ